jgi:hypothetical protein
VTDPYRPAPPAFPRARLQRAGLDADAVDRAETEWEAQDDSGRAGFASWVVANSDDTIRDRYAQSSPAEVAGQGTPDAGQQDAPPAEEPEQTPEPQAPQEQPVEQPAPEQSAPVEQSTSPATTGPTYEELNALTIDQLDARIQQWNTEHPDGPHLIVSGRKGEKIGRLLDAYEGDQQAEPPAEPPAAEQQLPTAPTATTPEGAPAAEAPSAGFVPPAGTVDAPDATAGAPEPAQTADAAPGADATPTEE